MFKVKMSNFKKDKKGVEAGGFAIIIAIVIVIISAIAILWVLKSSASKIDEELQVDLCRISNELLVGTEEASPWYLHGHSPRVCNTIWRTEKNLQIPTEKYKEKYKDEEEAEKKAAEAEITDLMAKCWYMWLEGSDPDVFPKEGIGPMGRWWGGEGCYICYAFMIKDEVDNINFGSLIDSMKSRTYTAKDSSDKCAPNGGFLEDDCSKGANGITEGWKKASLKDNQACCIRENIMDECGNKGGGCFETEEDAKNKGFEYEYPKWSCPKAGQKCYVTEDNHYDYYEYLMSGGRSTGPVVTTPIVFKSGNIVAIAFHSYRDDKGAFIELSSWVSAESQHCKSD